MIKPSLSDLGQPPATLGSTNLSMWVFELANLRLLALVQPPTPSVLQIWACSCAWMRLSHPAQPPATPAKPGLSALVNHSRLCKFKHLHAWICRTKCPCPFPTTHHPFPILPNHLLPPGFAPWIGKTRTLHSCQPPTILGSQNWASSHHPLFCQVEPSCTCQITHHPRICQFKCASALIGKSEPPHACPTTQYLHFYHQAFPNIQFRKFKHLGRL